MTVKKDETTEEFDDGLDALIESTTEKRKPKDEDESSPVEDLIESIVEMPHVLFRKLFGKKDD
jgi:hypothetical protein